MQARRQGPDRRQPQDDQRHHPGRQGSGVSVAVRLVMLADGAVFLIAALLNWGVRIPLGGVTLAFSPSVWQAGIGEAVVAVSLLLAAATGRRTLSWLAFGISVAGIVFGLSSHAVQGAARGVHIVLIPLALLLLVLLLWNRRRARSNSDIVVRPRAHE